MTHSNKPAPEPSSLDEQRALWRRQVSTLPALRGGKSFWLRILFELVSALQTGPVKELDSKPNFPPDFFATDAPRRGAPGATEPMSWREYGRFLKSVGLAQVHEGNLSLTAAGESFAANHSTEELALLIAERFRLWSETLKLLCASPYTIEELDVELQRLYAIEWKSLGGARVRADWLEALGLIEGVGGRRWKATSAGVGLLKNCLLVTPEAISTRSTTADVLRAAPPEIEHLLVGLASGASDHEARSTYNIWVPSPPESPNKVENLRTIINAATDPIEREELLLFIASTFSLKRSSVDSMMPFLRASGLLHEIGLGVYKATDPAVAWIKSGDDVNFIRILHANMRFIGEMIQFVGSDVSRNDMYAEAQRYGLNRDKSRWIASFLEEVRLIEQPRYGSLRATATGLALGAELPLASKPPEVQLIEKVDSHPVAAIPDFEPADLVAFSEAPQALGLPLGKAFENATRDAFRALGFTAQAVGGSGDTDIVVTWLDSAAAKRTAIVETKARSNGHVSHTDISDVALETHKTRNRAEYVAVVGPAFSGDTIKEMASKRKWVLLDARRLAEIVATSAELGLGPSETGILFEVPNGHAELDRIFDDARRRLAVVSFVIRQLAEEDVDMGEAITARDMARDGRRSDLRPNIDEIIEALETVKNCVPGAIRVSHSESDPKFSAHVLGDVRSAVSKSRALCKAMEVVSRVGFS